MNRIADPENKSILLPSLKGDGSFIACKFAEKFCYFF